jgi:hypothetical protein
MGILEDVARCTCEEKKKEKQEEMEKKKMAGTLSRFSKPLSKFWLSRCGFP